MNIQMDGAGKDIGWLKVLGVPVGILLILFLALVVIKEGFAVSQLKGAKPQNTISVSAEGKVTSIPDLAVINVGVTTSGNTADIAQTSATENTNRIIDFVKGKGIGKDDISTSQFSIYPTYDYTNGRNTINGYQATQTIMVKVRGVDKDQKQLDTVLGGLTGVGANTINGVQLTFDDPDNLRQEARKLAIKKATEKAKELAQVSGLTLGKVVSISEGGVSGYPMPMAYGVGGGAMDMKSAVPDVEPGNQDISANMTVTFEVK